MKHSFSKTIQTPEQTKQINEQIQRIFKIFTRQLKTCLDNTESTYRELEQFEEKFVDENLKKILQKTLSAYKEIEPFEIAIVKNISLEPI